MGYSKKEEREGEREREGGPMMVQA